MSLLPKVVVSSAMIQLASVYALKAHVSGHRADIYLIEAARALAALAERRYVLPKDLEKAAEFVLPHRMRKNCEQELPQSDEPEDSDKNDTEKDQESENNNLGDDGEDPSRNHIVEVTGNGVTMMNHHRICRNFRRGRMMKSRFRRFTCNSSSALDTEREKTIYPQRQRKEKYNEKR